MVPVSFLQSDQKHVLPYFSPSFFTQKVAYRVLSFRACFLKFKTISWKSLLSVQIISIPFILSTPVYMDSLINHSPMHVTYSRFPCTTWHKVWVTVSSQPHQECIIKVLIFANMIGKKWYLSVALIFLIKQSWRSFQMFRGHFYFFVNCLLFIRLLAFPYLIF